MKWQNLGEPIGSPNFKFQLLYSTIDEILDKQCNLARDTVTFIRFNQNGQKQTTKMYPCFIL